MIAIGHGAANPSDPGSRNRTLCARRTPRMFVWGCVLGALLYASGTAGAAYTEPRLALTRATPFRSASGRFTVKIEGTFSFADALQLSLPVSVTVSQVPLQARFDLHGNVFTSINGGPEQPDPGPGLIGIGQREITVVLPAGFTAGQATIQVNLTYEDRPIASNQLTLPL